MLDVANAFKKGKPITARPSNIAKSIFDQLQGDLGVGETMDKIIREAANKLRADNVASEEVLNLLEMWDALDQVGEKFNGKGV